MQNKIIEYLNSNETIDYLKTLKDNNLYKVSLFIIYCNFGNDKINNSLLTNVIKINVSCLDDLKDKIYKEFLEFL